MELKENLFIKVQLEKEQQTGKLRINIYFDKNAPNFYYNNETISWYPTMDELSFINETFTLLNQYKPPSPPVPQKTSFTTTTPTTTPNYTKPTYSTPPPITPTPTTPHTPTTPTTPQPTTPPSYNAATKKDETPIVTLDEKPLKTFPITADASLDKHIQEPNTKQPFKNDASPEEILASIPGNTPSTTHSTEEEKLIQADDKSITKALLEKLKKDHY